MSVKPNCEMRLPYEIWLSVLLSSLRASNSSIEVIICKEELTISDTTSG